MEYVRTHPAVLITMFILVPVSVFADSGEGFLEMILLGAFSYLNFLWPVVLPMFFLNNAIRKFSSYIYSVIVCGTLAWVLTYAAPRQLVPWFYPELTVRGLRIVLLWVLVATVLSFIISLRIVPKIRDFNDSHD